ncbi:auxin-responsive protein [Striga asiatica]|uniref:Auxin-responsive protein n=1 Tax=Striga asiatica TaxID=4170 RepID=A0A5A7R4M1_STRAF|nr:auxin-responsive protein [Striga asiatica]
MWQERKLDEKPNFPKTHVSSFRGPSAASKTQLRPILSGGFDEVAAMVPPVTVVVEGRSICHRISLHKHGGYRSLALALRQIFIDNYNTNVDCSSSNNNSEEDEICGIDLSNAVPGHLIAYEDMENDLLLVGDLNWKDFVRVAKRIRILPAKAKSRKQKDGESNI